MTATTDTNTITRETVEPDTTRPGAETPSRSRRAMFAWALLVVAALAVAGLAVVAFAGDDSADVPAIPFNPEADRIERQAHLDGAAETYGIDPSTIGEAP